MNLRRLAAAWRRHGPSRFAYLIGYNLWDGLLKLAGFRQQMTASDVEFDRRYGVDTARPREVGEMDVDPLAARYAVRYQATSVGTIRGVLGALGIDYADYSLIDYGSGKGRVLLVASSFPFRRIVGVEFSRELHGICEANIARYNSADQQCRDLSSFCIDAAAFEPPAGPLVCYFYNPFGSELMTQVATRLARHAAPVTAVYVEPVAPEAFDQACWSIARRSDGCIVYHKR